MADAGEGERGGASDGVTNFQIKAATGGLRAARCRLPAVSRGQPVR
jgi:hypothetical protein